MAEHTRRRAPACTLLLALFALGSSVSACGKPHSRMCRESCPDGEVCDDICPPDCVPGTLGCSCGVSDECEQDDGGPLEVACMEGQCVHVMPDLPAPLNGKCYTPCSDDLVAPDGSVRSCDSQGLLAGCIGAATCFAGSCSVPLSASDGGMPSAQHGRSCASDVDCPDFQGCRQDLCYSDCEVNSDCQGGYECRRHVCRVSCNTATENGCPQGYVCSTEDGVQGVCQPSSTARDAGPAAPPTSQSRFALSTSSLAFSNQATSGKFAVTNTADIPLKFTVRRVDHTETRTSGRVTETELPLFWLEIGPAGQELTRAREFELALGAGETREVEVQHADNEELDQWEGHLEVFQAGSGSQPILLTYSTSADGLWSGSLYYLVNFDEGGPGVMDAFIANPKDRNVAENTHNALLALWSEFARNELFTLQQWLAVVAATRDGSWDYPLVRQACEAGLEAGSDKRCYPYVSAPDDTATGIETYTDSTSLRIPTGVLEMPFAMALRQASSDTPRVFTGAVQSATALQYPGNPGVRLKFGSDPKQCESKRDACLVTVETFSMSSYVGARRFEGATQCASTDAASYTHKEPWLVDSFLQGTKVGDGGGHVRRECREASFPRYPGSESARLLNASFAGANPVPDGLRRQRNLELLDGRLINQDTLFLLLRETFVARMDGGRETPIAGYGMAILKRTPADLSADAYVPAAPPAAVSTNPPTGLLAADGTLSCPDLPVADYKVTASGAENAIKWLIDGVKDASALVPIDSGPNHYKAYYLCHATGHFNGGDPRWFNSATPSSFPEPCPADSQVTYFLWRGPDDLTRDSCQGSQCANGFCGADAGTANPGTCGRRLADLQVQRKADLVMNPVYYCTQQPAPGETSANAKPDLERARCDLDRQHLLAEKIFYEPELAGSSQAPSMLSLATTMDHAFQYRTHYRSNTGAQVGFVPVECDLETGDITPFCYDPQEIEQLRARIDCIARIYRAFPLSGEMLNRVEPLLTTSFGGDSDEGVDGFERMYSELLVMLGDDSYTRALGSRFDTAGAAIGSFDGDDLEPNGLVLSGGAGFEMTKLYQARQAYELVLDRFYRQSGVLWEDVARSNDAAPRLVRAATMTNYVDRIVLASTRKARVSSEIAKHYQGFGRPDLARHVIERDFARSYLESVVLNELFNDYARVIPARQLTILQLQMARTQNLYRIALEKMRETYGDLTDDLTYFGDPPDYIPFPSPRRYDLEAPQVMIDRATETMQISKERDARAISSLIDAASDFQHFQAELRRVEMDYEAQLGELCGTFTSEDGHSVFAAIPKYAKQDPIWSLLGINDPCGMVGNGSIYTARGDVAVAATDLRMAVQEVKDIFKRVAIEQRAIDQECAGRLSIAALTYDAAGQVISLETEQRAAEFAMSNWERALAVEDRLSGALTTAAQTAQQYSFTATHCTAAEVGGDLDKKAENAMGCVSGWAATALYGVAAGAQAATLVTQVAASIDTAAKQLSIQQDAKDISNIQRTAEAKQQIAQCDLCPDGTLVTLDPLVDQSLSIMPLCWGKKPGGGVIRVSPVPGPLRVEAQARIDTLMVDLTRARLNGERAQLNLSLAQGRVQNLVHQAQRLIAQEDESTQMLIDIEAARNDPNIRLLRNADVMDADRVFQLALIDAYRATRVFEYYSAQSYAAKGQLFFSRLAARGEFSVENYLIDLQRAMNQFENTYGRPAKRVQVVSLRDDILRIPRLGKDGVALSESDRIELFRKALIDPDRLNARGYLTFPFSIGPDVPSPLTSIHKIEHLEAEIQGSGVGDRLGRVYVTSRGTATLRDLQGELSYLRLPAITSVVDTFFNGVKPVFVDPEVYQDLRLRERPLLNSLWELSLNLRDEQSNRDIQVQELTDVRLYVYYEDFTQLE
ncbi:MAG: hypothetical protein QM778_28470 [Myxococcales bacterium]